LWRPPSRRRIHPPQKNNFSRDPFEKSRRIGDDEAVGADAVERQDHVIGESQARTRID